jgi:hypothetical protein
MICFSHTIRGFVSLGFSYKYFLSRDPHAMLPPLPIVIHLHCAPANTDLLRKSRGPPPCV